MNIDSNIKLYRDLSVWQRAIQMASGIYKATRSFPKEELYGLVSQLRRAGVSVASNIAEGYGRNRRGEYRQPLCIERGSNYEVQTQLTVAGGLEYVRVLTFSHVRSIPLKLKRCSTR